MKKSFYFTLALAAALAFSGLALYVQSVERERITPLDRLAPAPIAIVLGAPPYDNDAPAAPLQDRLTAAVELYRLKRVEKLLVTGDDGRRRVAEVPFMKQRLLESGIPPAAVLEDPQGYRTYESCRRARENFGVTRAIVITQRFHLRRTLYLCSRLGLDVQGYAADRGKYDKAGYFFARELVASIKAWLDVNVRKPTPPTVKPMP